MTTMTKRGTVFAIAMLMLVMSIFVPMRKARAAMTYNNTINAHLSANVTSSGFLQATMNVTGIKGKTSKIDVSLYVEKRVLGIFWTRVDIGYDNNIWTDSTTSSSYSSVFSTSINATGTYRVTVTYTVSGSGGSSDVITLNETVNY